MMDALVIKGDNWQDITSQFKSSVMQLNLGELLKSDHFSLLEAMSAIELMDPKMDSGVMLRSSNIKILSLEQSVRLGVVKIKDLKPDELIGIMDETYACLTTWLEGHPLSQTVMTNLYLHDPELIEDKCLKAFSLASLKIVCFIERLVSSTFCIEEEDFLLEGERYKLAQYTNDEKTLSLIHELIRHYDKCLRDNSGTSVQSNTNSNHKKLDKEKSEVEQKDEPVVEFERPYLIAIVERLRFTFNLYSCFMIMFPCILKNNFISETMTEAQLNKSVKLVRQSVQSCDLYLKKCLEIVDKLKDSIDLGIKPKISNSVPFSEADYPTIMGFNPHINHKLLPAAYPRCPSIKSRPETVEYLRSFIIKLRECISISRSFHQKSYHKSVDSMENFSKYFIPKSCVVSRSFLQALYLPNRASRLLRAEIYQSMLDYCEPMVQNMRKETAKSSALDEFILECLKPFSTAIVIYGHNTARQHEKFPELITAFKGLQYSALLINSAFNNSILYSWTTCNLARLCIKYVLSGLELELFSAYEYPYVFWYLYDILYRNEREQLEVAKQYIIESQLNAEDSNKKIRNKKQRRKNQSGTSSHDKGILCNDAFRFLSGGLFLITYGLRLQGKIRSPCMDYTSEQVCFDHRFGILTGTSVYNSYKQTLTRLDKLEFIYREAQECFSEAKILFDTIEDYENCLKVCKTNMVVARILSSNADSIKNRDLEFSFDTHPSFPTVKV